MVDNTLESLQRIHSLLKSLQGYRIRSGKGWAKLNCCIVEKDQCLWKKRAPNGKKESPK